MWAVAGTLSAQTSLSAALAATHSVPRSNTAAAFPEPATTLEAALHQAFLDADIAFTGEVTSISQENSAVLIRWHVEQGIKGVSSGGSYALREWAGLWSGGTARYTVGQRALMLLHAPSGAGYASPVPDGLIPLRGNAGSSTVDLRWMAQHVAVTDTPRLTPMLALRAAGGSVSAAAALQAAAARNAAQARAPHLTAPEPPVDTAPGPSAARTGSDPNARVDGGMVLEMLRAWQRPARDKQ